MGFDEGRMVLDSPNGAYYSGQIVRGNLIFQQDSVKKFRGIYVKFRGFCKVHWTTTETRRVNDRHETYTKVHESYEEYINSKIYLVGGESGEHHIQPGHYDYPFTFQIPGNCPSSFEGEYGHVRYEIEAVVDRAFKFDQEKKVAVRLMAPLDLNMDPYCREPIVMEINESYCCCCFSSGSTETVINAPMSGYCPGQRIPIEIACSNKGNVEISHIKIRIVKKVVFIATSHPDRRSNKDVIAEIKKSSIPGNTTRNWIVDLEVPAIDVYNMSACRYIDIDYKLEVEVSPEGCHSDSEEKRKIIIGTIPLVGFQDNVPNPLQDQMPQQIVAVTQQPMSSHPITSPYPYPGGNGYQSNPPYTVTSPLLNTNAPYPTNDSMKSPYGNTPYPQSNPPYSATNSPYPPGPNTTNPPYPANDAMKSPYAPSVTPYPIGTPNTVTNPPYPTNDQTKSPYPVTNSPYPPGTNAANAPYPTTDSMKSPYAPSVTPYPTGNPNTVTNSPYPPAPGTTTNPPYPSENSPYPNNPPPYPGISSPYPPAQQSTPNQMGSMPGTGTNTFGGGRLLKTGNIGFTVQGSNVPNMPFPGSAVPTSPASVNPYMAASAPNMDSPDIEKK